MPSSQFSELGHNSEILWRTQRKGAEVKLMHHPRINSRLTPTETEALFKKIAENGAWGADRVTPTSPEQDTSTGTAKSVLEVDKMEILGGKIDSLMRRFEKMESGESRGSEVYRLHDDL
ncbi:hypothetical protein U9M48_034421 [Paspalum notatum var. saurae]|uniref:Uncharacterized protein n=1 Tax=Paspalum notatum var. saurae TaxID=547442 RepID=A0AAQ3X719_PASNO